MIATIRPTKIAIYVNQFWKSMATVKSETGCQYIINGGLFEGSKACCQLKAGGTEYANDGYNYYGFAWTSAEDFSLRRVPCDLPNYIACVDLLRGGATGSMNYNAQIAGARERSAIGTKADGSVVLYCAKASKTPEQLRDIMKSAGCVDALMLDGGGSSQADFNGQKVTASRKVHNLICFWTEDISEDKNMAVYKKGSQGAGVELLQSRLNDCGAKLTVDGDFGNATDAAVKSFQKDMGLTSDGIAGALTQTALEIAASWTKSKLPLVLKAGKHLGVSEPNGDDNIIDAFNDLAGSGFSHSDAWCQMFAVVVQAEAGLSPYTTASCTLAWKHYTQEGKTQATPDLGYLVYFDWDASGDSDHVGIVFEEKDGYIYVIEGNSGGIGYDAVRIKRYKTSDSRIKGYANPYTPPKEYYIVKLERAAALKLAADYGGEIVKWTL